MAVIFISRGTVSGVEILIDCLSKRKKVTCLSREDLMEEIRRHGDWATTAIEQLSKATSAYEHFSRIRRPYVVLMRQSLLGRIRMGDMVYHGFSGHLILPHLEHFVRVRINAPLSLRLTMTMERLKCNEDDAREYIRSSDEHQVRWARFVYGHDIRNPALYDLNINLGHLDIEEICAILEYILLESNLTTSDEHKSQVDQLFMEANVEAALVIDTRTRELEIGARLDNGCVCLTGPYLDDAVLAVVMEIAGSIDGVERVEYSPGYASQYHLEEREENL